MFDATSDRQNDKIITWHARRFANWVEWKIESEANDTAGSTWIYSNLNYSRSVQVYELKPFRNKHSSQLIEKCNSCADLCKCFAVLYRRQRRKRSRTAFFLCRSELLADVLKHFRNAKCTSYNLTETSIQCKCLNYKLTSRSVIAVHIYRCFVVWCRAKETGTL